MIFANFYEICSDFQKNAEKRCNLSKFLDVNLMFIMITPQIYLIFDLIFNLIFTEAPPPLSRAGRVDAQEAAVVRG